MALIGALIAIGAAVAFLVVGALALFGGADATQHQLLPGFRPDRPGPLERALAVLSVWGPIALIVALCLLAAIRILRVALNALA